MGKHENLACAGACDVTCGTIPDWAGAGTWLVQVFMSLVAGMLIGHVFIHLACVAWGRGGALPADEQPFASSMWGSPAAAGCQLQEVPGLWWLRGRMARGTVMWHLPGRCELTWPGPGILRSGLVKASWVELAFGIIWLLPLLLA